MDNIHLHVVRYREQVGSLEKTNQIAESLNETYMTTRGAMESCDEGIVYETESDCRTNPFISESGNPAADFSLIMRSVNTTPHELRFSNLYEKKLRADLEPYIAAYSQAIMGADAQVAEDVLSEFFNAAKDLRQKMEHHIAQQSSSTPHKALQAKSSMLYEADDHDRAILDAKLIQYGDAQYREPAFTQSGGSCPVSRSSGGGLGALKLDEVLSSGDTIESLTKSGESSTHYESYECPGCGGTLSGESKSDKSSWRKECENCGHKLGC